MKKKKNIVITGAAGFLGSHFINKLNTKKYNVYGIDSNKFKFNGVIALVSDLKNINNLIHKLPSTIDYLYHFAAIKDISICEKDYDKTYFNNTYLTLNLIFQLRQRIKNLIFTSSCAVYGENTVPTKEEFPPYPLSFYAASKLSAENYCLLLSRVFNINTVILRLFNIYGKCKRRDLYQGVIIRFMNQIKRARPVTIYGDGKQFRDFISVDDVCKILLILLHKLPEGNIVNVGTGEKTCILELYHLLQKISGRKVGCHFAKHRKFEIYGSLADNKKLVNFLSDDFSFTNLKDGLRSIYFS